MDAGPAGHGEVSWRPWIHGVWADLTLLSFALMRIQQLMLGAQAAPPPAPAAALPGGAGPDWLQAYA